MTSKWKAWTLSACLLSSAIAAYTQAMPWPRPPGSGFLRAAGPHWSALTATLFDANQSPTDGFVLSASPYYGGRIMARKNRSLRKGSPKPVDIDVVGLYDELAPSWKLGSPDTTVAFWN